MENNMKKTCSRCKVEKLLIHFGRKGIGYRSICKDCRKLEYLENREEILMKAKKRYDENGEEVCRRVRNYRIKNLEKVTKREKEYREKNIDNVRKRKREYYRENKDNILSYQAKRNAQSKQKEKKKQYDKNRRKDLKVKERTNFLCRERKKKDPAFKLMTSVVGRINTFFRENKFSKNGKIWKILPYTPKQLREHIENQFDENMSWENHGTYWHVDHIIPQSALKYNSLEHPNFQKCWALENLRPLEATANLRKGKKLIPMNNR